MAVELLLLLSPADIEFSGVRLFPNTGRAAVGLGLLDAETGQIRLTFGDSRRRGGLTLPRLGQPRASGFDHPPQLTVSACEEDLLPAAEFLAQSPVTSSLGGLTLECPSLLLDLEHDVVNAGEVLLGRFELQLGGAST